MTKFGGDGQDETVMAMMMVVAMITMMLVMM